MLSFAASFTGLERKAELFHAVQNRQAEMQSQLHDQMQVDMQVVRGLIDNVTISAEMLHETIDVTSSKIAQMGSSIFSDGSISYWASMALLGFALYRSGPWLAVPVVGKCYPRDAMPDC